jgi:predicted nucleic acid-binding protein
MKVLIDTNVLLDVFLQREPFFGTSSQVVGLADKQNRRMDLWHNRNDLLLFAEKSFVQGKSETIH